MRWPLDKVYVTQRWGVNPDIYSRFGYKGHNGVDLRLHEGDGTPVYAPHSGVVKERRFDADGYGNYLKIENDFEGSILAHLQDFAVNINKQVEEGELIGYGDNTGWSTGPHLHWGYYKFPRDRQNGYGGTIDPTPYLEDENMSVTYKGLDLTNQESMKVAVDMWYAVVHEGKYTSTVDVNHLKEDFKNELEYKQSLIEAEAYRYKTFVQDLANILGCTDSETEIVAQIKKLINTEDLLGTCRDQKRELEQKVTSEATRADEILQEVSVLTGTTVKTKEGLKKSLASYLKSNGSNPPVENFSVYDLLVEIFRRATSWLKRS